MCNYVVYKHTLPNKKVYIGITKQNPKTRWQNGYGYKGNILFFRAIKKYGWENIKHTILFQELTKTQAEQKEIDLIKQYKSNNPEFGYNIENGGNCFGTHSEETKIKISIANKGQQKCLGRKISQWHIQRLKEGRIKNAGNRPKRHLSDEQKENIRRRLIGKPKTEHCKKILSEKAKIRFLIPENNGMFGKHHTIETRDKIRQKSLGRKLSAETISKIIKKQQKAVIRIDKDGLSKEYESIKTAGIQNNIKPQNVWFCCKHPNRTAGGYYWSYKQNN